MWRLHVMCAATQLHFYRVNLSYTPVFTDCSVIIYTLEVNHVMKGGGGGKASVLF